MFTATKNYRLLPYELPKVKKQAKVWVLPASWRSVRPWCWSKASAKHECVWLQPQRPVPQYAPSVLKDLEPEHVTHNHLLNNDVAEARHSPCVSNCRHNFILYILTRSLKEEPESKQSGCSWETELKKDYFFPNKLTGRWCSKWNNIFLKGVVRRRGYQRSIEPDLLNVDHLPSVEGLC